MKIRETDAYIEIDILHEFVTGLEYKVGFAEINTKTKELTRFKIYEPFQNQGIGTAALNKLLEEYDIEKVNVVATNDRAKHLYEKCGFIPQCCSMVELYHEGRTDEED